MKQVINCWHGDGGVWEIARSDVWVGGVTGSTTSDWPHLEAENHMPFSEPDLASASSTSVVYISFLSSLTTFTSSPTPQLPRTAMDPDHFALCVQSLPPELYSMIYDNVFTAEPGEYHITENYKPPSLLSIGHVSGESFANSFYDGRNRVYIHHVEDLEESQNILQLWLNSLPEHHLAMLETIKITMDLPAVRSQAIVFEVKFYESYQKMSRVRKQFLKDLRFSGVKIKSKVIQFECRLADVDGQVHAFTVWVCYLSST